MIADCHQISTTKTSREDDSESKSVASYVPTELEIPGLIPEKRHAYLQDLGIRVKDFAFCETSTAPDVFRVTEELARLWFMIGLSDRKVPIPGRTSRRLIQLGLVSEQNLQEAGFTQQDKEALSLHRNRWPDQVYWIPIQIPIPPLASIDSLISSHRATLTSEHSKREEARFEQRYFMHNTSYAQETMLRNQRLLGFVGRTYPPPPDAPLLGDTSLGGEPCRPSKRPCEELPLSMGSNKRTKLSSTLSTLPNNYTWSVLKDLDVNK